MGGEVGTGSLRGVGGRGQREIGDGVGETECWSRDVEGRIGDRREGSEVGKSV